ncbi:MAG: hypothetical protein ACXIUM_12145 [Wenzhouxiangella sp.]
MLEARRSQSEASVSKPADQNGLIAGSSSSIDLELRFAECSTVAELQHEMLARAAYSPPSATLGGAPPAIQASLIELIEKHVRRILISAETERGESGQSLMLRLNDEVLRHCDLRLQRTAGGWRLEASSSDSGTVGVLSREVDRIKERFALAGLGEIDVHVAVTPASDD